MEPIIIVGTGLAGYSLAREFRKLDKETPITMISRDDGHSYSKPMLSTGFTKGKSADELSMGDPGKMAQQLQVSIRNFTEIADIDADNKQILIGDEAMSYSKLVLATGASVNRLKFPGSDLPSVLSINDLMDYRQFRDAIEGRKHVLIMGAGLIGCEYANDLIEGGYEVTIVDPSKTAMNGLIPDFAGDALVEGLKQAGANILLENFVTEISEEGEGVVATLNDGQTISADLVLSAVGLKPDLALAQAAELQCNRGIVVDRALQTNVQDIYALGDCAEVDGQVLLYVLPLMACARALAKTLAGETTTVSYGVMPVVTKTPACPVVVNPPMSDQGEWHIEEQNGQSIKALFKLNDELLGFVLTGDYVGEKQVLSKQTKAIHA